MDGSLDATRIWFEPIVSRHGVTVHTYIRPLKLKKLLTKNLPTGTGTNPGQCYELTG